VTHYVFLIYGALAVLALWACGRDRDLQGIGACLVFGWAFSNLLDWSFPATAKPGPYTFIEILVALFAYLAWENRQERRILLVMCVNIVSICANIALALNNPPDRQQIYAHALTTNLCFAAECLLVTWAGIVDGLRIGRFHRWPFHRRLSAEPRATGKTAA
jgi:hypothetical protein